jgi:hypothetical protein
LVSKSSLYYAFKLHFITIFDNLEIWTTPETFKD